MVENWESQATISAGTLWEKLESAVCVERRPMKQIRLPGAVDARYFIHYFKAEAIRVSSHLIGLERAAAPQGS